MAELPNIIREKSVGCLCTVDETGSPSGATVFYAIKNEKLYIISHKGSQKVKSIQQNHKVCLVVADDVEYKQAQLYAIAKIIDNPDMYMPLLEEVFSKHAKDNDTLVPYMYINDEGGPVMIELTPQKNVHFSTDGGLVEQKLN